MRASSTIFFNLMSVNPSYCLSSVSFLSRFFALAPEAGFLEMFSMAYLGENTFLLYLSIKASYQVVKVSFIAGYYFGQIAHPLSVKNFEGLPLQILSLVFTEKWLRRLNQSKPHDNHILATPAYPVKKLRRNSGEPAALNGTMLMLVSS